MVPALGKTSHEGPCDITRLIGEDGIDGGNAGAMGDGNRFLDGADLGEVEVVEIKEIGEVSDPLDGVGGLIPGGRRDWAENGFADLVGNRIGSPDFDDFVVDAERAGAPGSEIMVWIGGIGNDFNQVEKIDVGVGETKGDMPVTADDDARDPREGDANLIDGGAQAVEAEAGAVPCIGDEEAEVHIDGQLGVAGIGQAAADGPCVAAGDITFRGGGSRWGWLRRWPLRRRWRGQDGAGISDHGDGMGKAIAEKELKEIRGELSGGHGPVLFIVAGLILEVEEHGEADEDGIDWLPWLWFGAEDEIGPWAAVETGQAGVNAVGVGAEAIAVACRHLLIDSLGAGAHAVEAAFFIERDGAFPEEGGEFAGGGAAEEIHLEEAVLPMGEAEAEEGIQLGGGLDGGNPGIVALQLDGCIKTGNGEFALERGEATAQENIADEHGERDGEEAAEESGQKRTPEKFAKRERKSGHGGEVGGSTGC